MQEIELYCTCLMAETYGTTYYQDYFINVNLIVNCCITVVYYYYFGLLQRLFSSQVKVSQWIYYPLAHAPCLGGHYLLAVS